MMWGYGKLYRIIRRGAWCLSIIIIKSAMVKWSSRCSRALNLAGPVMYVVVMDASQTKSIYTSNRLLIA